MLVFDLSKLPHSNKIAKNIAVEMMPILGMQKCIRGVLRVPVYGTFMHTCGCNTYLA